MDQLWDWVPWEMRNGQMCSDVGEGMGNFQGWGWFCQEKQSWVGPLSWWWHGGVPSCVCGCGDEWPLTAAVPLASSSLTGGEPLQRLVRHPLSPGLPPSRSLPESCSLAVWGLKQTSDVRSTIPLNDTEESSAAQKGRKLVQGQALALGSGTQFTRLPFQSTFQYLQCLNSNSSTSPWWRHLSHNSTAASLGPDSAPR